MMQVAHAVAKNLETCKIVAFKVNLVDIFRLL